MCHWGQTYRHTLIIEKLCLYENKNLLSSQVVVVNESKGDLKSNGAHRGYKVHGLTAKRTDVPSRQQG